MKKAVLTLSLFLGLLVAHAESCLVLQLRDGKTFSYVLNQQPVITFGNDMLMLKSADAEADFQLADIENFHFADTEDGIRTVTDDECRFTFTDGIITVEGQHGQVMLTDLSGHPLHSAASGQTFIYNMHDQPQGIYLMRIGQQSIKLYHK